jgi:hypothetical protein
MKSLLCTRRESSVTSAVYYSASIVTSAVYYTYLNIRWEKRNLFKSMVALKTLRRAISALMSSIPRVGEISVLMWYMCVRAYCLIFRSHPKLQVQNFLVFLPWFLLERNFIKTSSQRAKAQIFKINFSFSTLLYALSSFDLTWQKSSHTVASDSTRSRGVSAPWSPLESGCVACATRRSRTLNPFVPCPANRLPTKCF